MKVNQTFPKQMKDSDQEQSEHEAGALRAVVIQSSPRHGRASRFLPWKTGYCSLAAPGKPLSITPGRSGTPRKGSGGYQGEGGRAEVSLLPCLHASLVVLFQRRT